MIQYIDTHAHLDGEEFANDLEAVVARAREAGVHKVFVPAINLNSCHTVLGVARRFPGFAYSMLGLHPEEVRGDWREVLREIKALKTDDHIAVGEVGLDYYWSREFEREQLQAFEEQVQWAVEWQLPLMIHCRKAQNELVKVLRPYAKELAGGIFHCFTGNAYEAEELLQFEGFALGIGGVLTFKKSHLPEMLPATVPLDCIVLETDAPYMAPVPCRGQRNEPAYTQHILRRLSEVYGVGEEEVAARTNATVSRIFGLEEYARTTNMQQKV